MATIRQKIRSLADRRGIRDDERLVMYLDLKELELLQELTNPPIDDEEIKALFLDATKESLVLVREHRSGVISDAIESIVDASRDYY